MSAIAPPRGTRDLLPADETGRRWLLTTHDRLAAGFGYQLIDTPIFESTELFARGVGAGTDVVDKEMYTFVDRGGRSVTLRPEGTAGVLRAVLGARLLDDFKPVRVHYAGPMFRYDRPQRGRYRQFSTAGVECIGERSPHLDAEVIELAATVFSSLGIADISLQVNTLGDLEDRRRYRQALIDHFSPLRQELCETCRHRLDVNPLRLLDCKVDAPLVAGAPSMAGSLSSASAAYFDTVLAALRAAGVAAQVNPTLARGLDYYSDTAFEFWHTSLQGAQNALGGGGRYDGLAEIIGHQPTPGVGYGLGVDRILDVAANLGLVPGAAPVCAVVVAAVGGEGRTPGGDIGSTAPDAAGSLPHAAGSLPDVAGSLPHAAGSLPDAAAGVARRLRREGIATVHDVSDPRLERKLREADRRG
ncbi:MAG: histidine--tRNA ligase, partial [Candidatus Dormibacteria bacterium]